MSLLEQKSIYDKSRGESNNAHAGKAAWPRKPVEVFRPRTTEKESRAAEAFAPPACAVEVAAPHIL
jgi:hypothetical protein